MQYHGTLVPKYITPTTQTNIKNFNNAFNISVLLPQKIEDDTVIPDSIVIDGIKFITKKKYNYIYIYPDNWEKDENLVIYGKENNYISNFKINYSNKYFIECIGDEHCISLETEGFNKFYLNLLNNKLFCWDFSNTNKDLYQDAAFFTKESYKFYDQLLEDSYKILYMILHELNKEKNKLLSECLEKEKTIYAYSKKRLDPLHIAYLTYRTITSEKNITFFKEDDTKIYSKDLLIPKLELAISNLFYAMGINNNVSVVNLDIFLYFVNLYKNKTIEQILENFEEKEQSVDSTIKYDFEFQFEKLQIRVTNKTTNSYRVQSKNAKFIKTNKDNIINAFLEVSEETDIHLDENHPLNSQKTEMIKSASFKSIVSDAKYNKIITEDNKLFVLVNSDTKIEIKMSNLFNIPIPTEIENSTSIKSI